MPRTMTRPASRSSSSRGADARRVSTRHHTARAPLAGTRHAAVDAYIERALPFARPILHRLRAIVHRACPSVTETLKWGMPAFDYKGPLAGMAAFKQHCVFGFWKDRLLSDPTGALQKTQRTAMGNLGCIRTLADLPPAATLAALVKEAARLNDAGVKVPRTVRARKAIAMPPEFAKALRARRRALETFDALPPGHQREYLEWIVEAKRDETRAKRIATAVTWLSQGKRRNWKYETKGR